MKTELSVREFKKVLWNNSTPVEFSYVKKDGSVRVAHGTTNYGLIPENDQPKNGVEDNLTTIRYYDTDKLGWRAAIVENLISFIDSQTKNEIMIKKNEDS